MSKTDTAEVIESHPIIDEAWHKLDERLDSIIKKIAKRRTEKHTLRVVNDRLRSERK